MFEQENIRLRYLKVLEKIKNFLLAEKGREFLIFLFFVLVSFSFWLLQVLDDDYETELAIPIRLKDVPEDVMMTSELPPMLQVGVKDRGTVLANYLWGQAFFPVSLSFQDYEDKGNQVRIPAATLSKMIGSQLNQSTKLLTIKPDTLEFIYTKGKGKKLPVRLQGEVKANRQYYISQTVCSPDSVMVYAPQSILDTLTSAYTQPLHVENVSDTTHCRVDFLNMKGVKFVPAYIDVTFSVDVLAEKTVEVPVIGMNFPADEQLRTFPPKVQVTFQVGLSRFKEMTAEDFVVGVDFKELGKNGAEHCKPVLLKSPEGINHIRMNPGTLDYIIEQQVNFND